MKMKPILLLITVPIAASMVALEGRFLVVNAQTQAPIKSSPLESRPMTDSTPSQNTSKQRPLTDASPDEVAQAAINYTRANYIVTGGTPQVVLTRSVTTDQFSSLGFGEVTGSLDEKLMLVVLKGNFDVSNLDQVGSLSSPNSKAPTLAKYIVYVFDLRAGVPSYIETGLRGQYFRDLLKDPSLPDLPPPLLTETATREVSTEKLPYGTVLRGWTKDEIRHRGRIKH